MVRMKDERLPKRSETEKVRKTTTKMGGLSDDIPKKGIIRNKKVAECKEDHN